MYKIFILILSVFIFVGCATDADKKTINAKNKRAKLAANSKRKGNTKKVNINPNGKKMTPAQKRKLALKEKKKQIQSNRKSKRLAKAEGRKNHVKKSGDAKGPKKLTKRQLELREKRNKIIQQRKLSRKKALNKKSTTKKAGKKTYWDKFQKKIGYKNGVKTKLNRASTKHTREIKSLKNRGKWAGEKNKATRTKTLDSQNAEIEKILGPNMTAKKRKFEARRKAATRKSK